MKKRMLDIKGKLGRFINRVFKAIKNPALRILPGQLSFFIVLSIIPLVTLISVLGSSLSLSSSAVAEFISDIFPADIGKVIEDVVLNSSIDLSTIVLMITTLFLASNGCHSIIIASNVVFDCDKTNEIRKRVKAIFMAWILVFVLIFVLLIPTFGDNIIDLIKDARFIKPIYSEIKIFYNILMWPISFFIIYFSVKLIYKLAPDKNIPSKYLSYGSLFTTLFWIIASRIYSFYTINFTKYDVLYGSLSNVIAMMLWVYFLAYIFVLGMALNAGNIKDIEGRE